MRTFSGITALMVLCGFEIESIISDAIPQVHINLIYVFDSPGFTVVWDPLDHNDETNPVIGVKVKVWQAPCITEIFYKHVDDILMREERTHRKNVAGDVIIKDTPQYVCIAKADETNCTIPHIKIDIWYYVSALAFTKTEEGPLSSHSKFKLNPKDDSEADKTCNSTSIKPASYNTDGVF